jgi:hypothetical protein
MNLSVLASRILLEAHCLEECTAESISMLVVSTKVGLYKFSLRFIAIHFRHNWKKVFIFFPEGIYKSNSSNGDDGVGYKIRPIYLLELEGKLSSVDLTTFQGCFWRLKLAGWFPTSCIAASSSQWSSSSSRARGGCRCCMPQWILQSHWSSGGCRLSPASD